MSLGFSSMSQPGHMEHTFSNIPQANIERSSFKRGHCHKTSFDEAYLVPIYVDEVLPGDTFKLNLSCVARLTTPIAPFMDNVYMDFFFFFVPNRLVWDNFQKFMGQQANPTDSTDFHVPQIEMGATSVAYGSLADYMGIPISVTQLKYNSLHMRAYNLIWNEWFRDENLQNSVVVDKDDGPDTYSDYVLLKRGKRHDYFTSCLPWPQKGVAVELPLGTTAPVYGNGLTLGLMNATQKGGIIGFSSNNDMRATTVVYNTAVGTVGGTQMTSNASLGVTDEAAKSGLVADLSAATAATINELREAFQLQRLMERDARGGTRYTEIVRSHFGVVSPDARLQRPEYLGGGSQRIMIDPVPCTSMRDNSTTGNLGYLGAAGYCNAHGVGFTKSFVEHGVLIGLVSVRADLTYQQGLNRMWTRRTKYDYYWPALAHLGEQSVLNSEIYAQGTSDDALVFGYQERWAEYRYHPSMITSKLRSQANQGLDIWHLAQKFTALPLLNSTFITEAPPISRVVIAVNEPHFVFDGFFDVVTTRPMPTYSVPGLIDHF